MANKQKLSDIRKGQVYGRLTALRFDKVDGKYKYWFFQCECGHKKSIVARSVLSGLTKSCGCFRKENTANLNKSHGATSNGIREVEYNIYMGIIDRCERPESSSYKHYGAKGIRVCKRWRNSYPNFLEDMGRRPKQSRPREYSIERINTNKGYSPSNCRWATQQEQCNNKSNNTILNHKGESLTLAEWSRKTGIRYGSLLRRIKNNWPLDRALDNTDGRVSRFYSISI